MMRVMDDKSEESDACRTCEGGSGYVIVDGVKVGYGRRGTEGVRSGEGVLCANR